MLLKKLLFILLKNKVSFLYFQYVLFKSLAGPQEARHGCFKNVINISAAQDEQAMGPVII